MIGMKYLFIFTLFFLSLEGIAQIYTDKIIELDPVWVKGKRKRIVVSGDTLIIRTNDLATKPHSDASDIFNQIPGLSIDNGNVSIFGSTINQLTVDGKRIFGGVPIITLNSLKANMIQQIEIIERINEFGTVEKTVNLKLKEDRKKGGFGDISWGLGTEQRNIAKAKYNRLGTHSYTNFFLNANNLNEQGLDTKDIERLVNGMVRNQTNNNTIMGLYDNENGQTSENLQKLQNNSSGIRTTFDGGFNYTYTQKQNEINAFLLLSRTNQNIEVSQSKNTFWENNVQYLSTNNSSVYQKDNLQFNINGKLQISPKSSFRFSQQFIYDNNDKQDIINRFSRINDNQNINEVQTHRSGNESVFSHNFQGTLGIQGKKKGINSTFFVTIKNTFPREYTQFFNEINTNTSTKSQHITESVNHNILNFEYIQSLPISRKLLIETKLNHLVESVNSTQQLRYLSNNNAFLDNLFGLTNQKNEVGLYSLYQQRKWSFVNGLSMLNYSSNRKQNVDLRNNISTQSVNFLSKLNFKINNKSRLYLRYQIKTILPSWESIGEIPDSSRTESIRYGNIAITPYTEKSLSAFFTYSFYENYLLNLNISKRTFDNYIIDNTLINNWVQSYNRINSTKSADDFSINYSLFQLHSTNNLSFSLFGSFTQQNSQTLLNNNYAAVNAQLLFNNIQANYRVNKNNTLKSTLQVQSNWIAHQHNNLVTLSLNSNLSPFQNWYFDNNIRTLFGQTQSIFFDSELQRYFLKNDVLKVSFTVKNVLNTKADTKIILDNNSQIVTSFNYLPRYFLIKLSYFFENWANNKH
jgi:hypothetical protein